MTGQGVRWTAEQVLALAPDAASQRSGGKLAVPRPWSEAGSGDGALWGTCEGSGRTPYQTVVDLTGSSGPGYKCSCPSRKFPCKHALALLLLWAGGSEAVPAAVECPEWAGDWLRRRRERAVAREGAASSETATGTGQAADPAGARRRAERRHRAMLSGATELEQRLTDLLRRGLAGADQSGYAPWEEIAARMVDAQAPGLADRVRELGALPASGAGWPERLLSECALLHLLSQGLLALGSPEGPEGAEGPEASEGGQSKPSRGEEPGSAHGPGAAGATTARTPLPEPLASTVRARVGLTIDTAKLLADGSAKQRDEWLVLAQRDTDEGKLTTRRIWMYGRRTRRPALLLSFGAAGSAPQLALPVGSSAEIDLAFYPGGGPLRAALGSRHGDFTAAGVPEGAGGTVTDALAAYASALSTDPWLDGWPVVLRDVVPIPLDGGAWQLADADGDAALTVTTNSRASGLWKLTALSGGAPISVFGECGHRGFAPYSAWHRSGQHPEVVPL
ncbi:SWIM zinc finger family protein [Streptomyces oceani]|uniref:SWIM-type domain-containing protein n=1 Tax=Streptomyces oceani TaxID=1075402 RepID=A0A1E7KI33_9ACTN|nr:SWIM zinc finger family protein [Streptomyces oceani]OEV03555.1 hypothetical protein AN216_10835 [Streptomyces oceani]